MSRKRGVEPDTVATIKALQAKGVPVFALTARFSSMLQTTKLELASLSLDLSLTSPFKAVVRDTATNALISDGIIFTNANEKGPILNRFLANALFEKHLNGSLPLAPAPSSPPLPSSRPISIPVASSSAAASVSPSLSSLSMSVPSPSSSSSRIVFKTSKKLSCKKKLRGKFDDDEDGGVGGGSGSMAGRAVGGDDDGVVAVPTRVVFVDDRLQNCVSVMNGLRCTQQLGIAVLTYHYTPVLAKADAGGGGDGGGGGGQQ